MIALGDSAGGNVQPERQEQAPASRGGAKQPADDVALGLARRLEGEVAPLLEKYCLDCHSGKKAKGDVRLDLVKTLQDGLGMSAELSLAKGMLSTGEMPPKDELTPTAEERAVVVRWLEELLAYEPPAGELDPGWFTIHRLNRAEYRNTLRDLLGIDPTVVDVSARLPRDDTGYGFDNMADVLTMSPLAVEQYLDAAERAVELALGPEVRISDEQRRIWPIEGFGSGQMTPGGGFFLFANGSAEGSFRFPATGEYIVRAGAWETHGGDENAQLSLRMDGRELKEFAITGTKGKEETVEVRVRVSAGPHVLAAHFTNDYYVAKVADRNLGVEWISVAGPLDEKTTERPRAWQEVFGASDVKEMSDEDARAELILGKFAQKAYRRAVSRAEREGLIGVYRTERDRGATFEGAVRVALSAALVSPNFLYRSLENPDGGDASVVYRLDGYELASRLSYFLWSSMPDEALMSLASDGRLLDEHVLRGEVHRMLADEKSAAFVENFAGQWLQLRSLDGLAMDRAKFPEYDDDLRSAMVNEAKLFFGEVLRGDRSVLEFVDSDFSFLNERLAKFYGIEGVEGGQFRRVALPKASQRGGVLTMGAVLTVTSNTTRTSPVKRGLYVLDQILGAAPPPPPPGIPPLEEATKANPNATLREQLALHVANPSCATCHNRLDPMGLAFENFNAVGKWRDDDGGRPIDATGTLPGGVTFSGPAELKSELLHRGEQFIQTLSGKVLTYAIGRGLESFDRPAVRRIAVQTRRDGDRFRTMIEAVVLSETFRTCRGREQGHE